METEVVCAAGRARAELLQEAFGYLASGGLLVQSTTLLFYEELLRLGFAEVPGAAREDCGAGVTARTYALDLRCGGLASYVRRLAARHGGGTAAPAESAQETLEDRAAAGSAKPAAGSSSGAGGLTLTGRERSVAKRLLRGGSNPEIARALFLSEVSVQRPLYVALSGRA